MPVSCWHRNTRERPGWCAHVSPRKPLCSQRNRILGHYGVGRNLLASWERVARERFVKVMPRDYKRVLAELAERERAEAEPETAVEA